MSNIWFTSDQHLFHKNLLHFKRADGSPLRPEFTPKDPENPNEVSRCLRDMNETLIDNINKLVKPEDKLYNLGDVTFFYREAFIELYSRINTKKHRLLVGNHDDVIKLAETKLFKKIGLWRVFREFDFIASHVPIRKDSLKTNFQLAGHTHSNIVSYEDGTPDLKYINICVENTNYHPVNLEDIKTLIKARKNTLGIE